MQIQPVLPDVMVRPARDGSWMVELNNDTLPRVLVNRSYYTTVSKTAQSRDRISGYLLECLQNANWLVKSLDQRARTILRVAEEIVRQQDGFLTYGIAAPEAAQPEDGGGCHLDARVRRSAASPPTST